MHVLWYSDDVLKPCKLCDATFMSFDSAVKAVISENVMKMKVAIWLDLCLRGWFSNPILASDEFWPNSFIVDFCLMLD